MLRQQLTGRPEDMSGQLIINADPGALQALQTLASELSTRPDMVTQGEVIIIPPDEPPVTDGLT